MDDIIYLESENVYLNIYTAKRHFGARTKLDDFISNFSHGDFFRVHRSFAVNVKHLETINSLTVIAGGREIPLHKVYKQDLLNRVNSIK